MEEQRKLLKKQVLKLVSLKANTHHKERIDKIPEWIYTCVKALCAEEEEYTANQEKHKIVRDVIYNIKQEDHNFLLQEFKEVYLLKYNTVLRSDSVSVNST